MLVSRLLKLLPLCSALALACDQSSDLAPVPNPPSGYGVAFATPDCAPWDGRAIAIVLAGSQADSVIGMAPQIRVAVYPRADSVAGHSFQWPADPESAAATRCVGSRPCEAATSGEIHFRPGTDTALAGSLVLHFIGGDSVYGGFRAEWRPRQVFCG